MQVMESIQDAIRQARELIAAHRADCLWFLREGEVPRDPSRLADVLRQLEQHADRATFVQARRLRDWLSRTSSGSSAIC